MRQGRSDRQVEPLQAPEERQGPPFRRLVGIGQFQAGEPFEQPHQGDLGLQPGEGGADADMGAAAKGDMGSALAADIEPVGLIKDIRVTVRRPQGQGHRLAVADRTAANLLI